MSTSSKIKAIFCLLLFYCLSYSQTGWFQQSSGTSGTLRSVFFVNENTGFAAGDSSSGYTLILKTTNGGTSWVKQSPASPTGKMLRCVFFTDVNTGFACGTDFGNTGSGIIFKTTNSGANWNVNFSDFPMGFTSMYFVNSNTGYVVGLYKNSTSPLLKTTTAGQNWTVTPSISFYRMYSVYFNDAMTGWAAGEGGNIIKTSNGGVNWSGQTSGATLQLTAIQFVDANTGFAAGFDSRVRYTTNGGQVWTMLFNQSLCGLYGMYFSNPNTGWIVGCEAAIHGTTNGGINWQMQSFASTTYLYSVRFINSLTGWAVGFGGRILKTTTGGLTAIQPISNEIPYGYKLFQNYPNPFNPKSKIKFSIGIHSRQIAKLSETKLVVFDILGKEVESLVNEELSPGTYEVEWDATNYPSGVYYYKLVADNYTETKKMILIK